MMFVLKWVVAHWKGVLLAGLVAYFSSQIYFKGVSHERAAWQSRLDTAVKDRLQELREAASLDAERGALAAQRNRQRQEAVNEVRKSTPPGGPVVVPRDVARRLRDLR